MRRLWHVGLFLMGGAAAAEPALVVSYKGQRVDFTPAAVFALPGEAVEFRLESPETDDAARLTAEIGRFERVGDRRWRWLAPAAAGEYGALAITDRGAPDRRIDINAFVLIPAAAARDGYLGEYRIDSYPSGASPKCSESYVPPAGFVEVTERNRHLHVSPHFTIGQFVSKQQSDWPKYVVPDIRLYAKLENLLDAVRVAGYDADTLHIMSGYRTPFYNRAIGNVRFSRHIYGDAADVFVDIDDDEYMDDLNGDGIVSIADAATLAEWVEALDGEPTYQWLLGGLGIYDSTPYHGPFVHIDTRGYRARWGIRLDGDTPAEATTAHSGTTICYR